MGIVKDILLVFGGSMHGVTVMCIDECKCSSGPRNGKERKVTR